MKFAVAMQKSFLRTMFALPFILLFTSCTKVQNPSTDNLPRSVVTFKSKASSGVEYPITFCAVGAQGAIAQSITIANEDDNASLELVQGDYLMVAIAGTSGYDLSDLDLVSSVIKHPQTSGAGALMMGSANVTVAGATTVNINMSYKVSKLSLSLVDVPDDVSQVSVSFSPLYNEVNLYGEYVGDSQTHTLYLSQVGDVWSSGEFHLFAGAQQSTTLTVNFIRNDATESFGYTMSEALQAATPYAMTGSYSGGVSVDGNFTSDGWNDPKNISFEFGTLTGGGSTGGSGGDTDNGSGGDSGNDGQNPGVPDGEIGQDYTFSVTSFAEVGSAWKGHAVYAFESVSQSEGIAWLISLKCWNEMNVADCLGAASDYVEANLNEWDVPTSDQAREVQSFLNSGDNLSTFAQLRTTLGGDPINISEGVNFLKYLCDQGSKCFSLDSGQFSIGATSGLRSYSMFLVRPVKMKIVQ